EARAGGREDGSHPSAGGRPRVGDYVLALRHAPNARLFVDALVIDIALASTERPRAHYPAS
ncbi:hypothetical protein T484DRAFT_1798420, partial [Baffinella frigidus]